MTDEIPKRLTNSINRIKKRGGFVLVHHGEMGGATTFWTKDGGSVSSNVVSQGLRYGLLRSNNDGLFAAGLDPQSYFCV